MSPRRTDPGERLPFTDAQSETASLNARGAPPPLAAAPRLEISDAWGPTPTQAAGADSLVAAAPGASPATDHRSPITAYIDGGSRGNPGPAGYGVRILNPDDTVAAELQESIGIATNNVAEYRGLIAALAYALDNGYSTLRIRSDSLLLVNQMAGRYRVKNPGLQILHQQARDLAARLARVSYTHVPRAENAHADELANKAMDDAKD